MLKPNQNAGGQNAGQAQNVPAEGSSTGSMVDPFEAIFNNTQSQLLFNEDSGELDVSSFFGEEEGTEGDNTEVIDPISDGGEGNDDGKNPPPPDNFAAKMQGLESTVDKLSQVVIAMAGRLTNQQQQQQPVEEPQIDFSDAGQLSNFIAKTVQDAVRNATRGLSQDNQEVKLHMGLARAQAKYGDDFQAKLPMIGQLMQTDPEKWTFETAYDFISKLVPKTDGSAKPVVKQPATVNGNVVAQKAASLQSQADGGQAAVQKPNGVQKVKDIDQALNMAIAQMTRK
jgi:hypothetical protein